MGQGFRSSSDIAVLLFVLPVSYRRLLWQLSDSVAGGGKPVFNVMDIQT
jgi:hypothetical protein